MSKNVYTWWFFSLFCCCFRLVWKLIFLLYALWRRPPPPVAAVAYRPCARKSIHDFELRQNETTPNILHTNKPKKWTRFHFWGLWLAATHASICIHAYHFHFDRWGALFWRNYSRFEIGKGKFKSTHTNTISSVKVICRENARCARSLYVYDLVVHRGEISEKFRIFWTRSTEWTAVAAAKKNPYIYVCVKYLVWNVRRQREKRSINKG